MTNGDDHDEMVTNVTDVTGSTMTDVFVWATLAPTVALQDVTVTSGTVDDIVIGRTTQRSPSTKGGFGTGTPSAERRPCRCGRPCPFELCRL